jgi:hypothetical protein
MINIRTLPIPLKVRTVAVLAIVVFAGVNAQAQKKSIAQIKTELEQSPNPPLYVKDVLKKKFRFDTVAVASIGSYRSFVDSLAYHGKVKKVYGPFERGKYLVQILAKAPGKFHRVGQIFLDTSIFMQRFADSLAKDIIARINSKQTTFEDMAQTYSMGGEAATKGDLGWIAVGAMLPAIERELAKRKKGELFTVWTKTGLHIIRKTESAKDDVAGALMMRIFL